jgi:hypothetical protein
MPSRSDNSTQHVTDLIVSFLNDIGIKCSPCVLEKDTFLPGVDIQNGSIWYDPALMKYPGDLLHEAGHLAVLSAIDRPQAHSPDHLSGDLDPAAAEMGAIAWSWAALTHLQLPPQVVFHEHGYKGDSAGIIENFSNGRYIGLPILQWLRMTAAGQQQISSGENTYPAMKHWLRP